MATPDLDDLLREGRTIWGANPMTLPQITTAMGVVYGDICRVARAINEGRDSAYVRSDLRREIGNMILSSIRWADDLGDDPAACVQAAMDAQRTYVQARSADPVAAERPE